MTENRWRNPEGNPVIFDSVLLDFAWSEPRLTLFLDTVATGVTMDGRNISAVEAFSPSSGTRYRLQAPLFMDATGDGTLGFLAGARFRIGAENPDEFGEPLAPDQ